MVTGLSGANTAASTSPLLIPPRGDGPGPGNGEKGEKREGKQGREKEKKKRKKPLRRAGASCAGGRPVPGREGFTWPREEETPTWKRRRGVEPIRLPAVAPPRLQRDTRT